MLLANGTVFCHDGHFQRADVSIEKDIIASVGPGLSCGSGPRVEAEGCYVVPGFFDIHIHGAMGADFSDADPAAIRTMAEFLLSRGVTGFLGASMALPEDRLTRIYETARPMIGHSSPGGATLWGINMEGPFFNPKKRGAQNEKYIIPPDVEMFRRLHAASGGNIRTVALAPEMPGGLDFAREVSKLSNVSIAHTCADYDTARQAIAGGVNHITHVFNGMPAFHHRKPGVVGAAADSQVFVELICDGVHVHPAMVRSVFRLFGDSRVCLISDAMRACGMPDGRYELGGKAVAVANGVATIDSGSLAGSITVLSDCVKNAVRFGVPLESALKAATINPARSVGLDDRIGSILPGKRADLLLLNPDLSLRAVIASGVLTESVSSSGMPHSLAKEAASGKE